MRLFVGIELDDDARDACAAIAARLEASGLSAKYVEPTNYHMTIVFLGNVNREALPEIEAATATVAAQHAPFVLTFDRVGAFPHERKPRTAFVGSRGVDEAYRALARAMERACEALGYPSDKDAIPHVTLARVPERTRATLPMIDVAPFAVRIEAVTIFESLPHEGKTRYITQRVFEFGAIGTKD